MKRALQSICAVFLCLLLCLTDAAAWASRQRADLTMRLSTRSGPSTSYTEPGTFFGSSWQYTSVTVLSKAFANGVWWVQVEFEYNGRLYRAYTGAKRVDVNLSAVPEETALGAASLNTAGEVSGYYGPGDGYAVIPEPVPWSVSGTVIAAEDGYLLFDFYDEDCREQRRAWVYADHLDVSWYNGRPEGSILTNQAQLSYGDLFIAETDASVWCRMRDYRATGSWTTFDLYLGSRAYPQLSVYMDGRDHGAFTTADGCSGEVWFYTDQLVIEAYMPWAYASELYVMPRLQ